MFDELQQVHLTETSYCVDRIHRSRANTRLLCRTLGCHLPFCRRRVTRVSVAPRLRASESRACAVKEAQVDGTLQREQGKPHADCQTAAQYTCSGGLHSSG